MQRRPAAGRPSGTDGSDFSYRMVVEPKYVKVGVGKARLKIIMLLQVLVQLIGVLFVFLYSPNEGVINPFTIFAVVYGAVVFALGELGRRRSHVDLLQVYNGLAAFSTMISVLDTGRVYKQWMLSKEPEYLFWNSTSADVYYYCHMLLGLLVSFTKAYIVFDLVTHMSPSKKNE
ncbi:jagunal-like protein [Thalictrum thalictroides]|uniref:Jagunal-like protein n=1 Tax=Thalictrum thalictroides TaxID=46969 RepID=A0A7J6XBG1_THATH|nr:jagunal-like protein [Thalictrum thalictroides]